MLLAMAFAPTKTAAMMTAMLDVLKEFMSRLPFYSQFTCVKMR
jgi:hypothetical protein